MKTLWLTAFFLSAPMAFGLPKVNCDSNHNDFRTLVQKTTVRCWDDGQGHVGCTDPRGPVREIFKNAHLPEEEAETADASTLIVDCENNGPKSAAGSGGLYGNCRQFVTNAHVINDGKGMRPSRCHVFNTGEPHFDLYVPINDQTVTRLKSSSGKNLDLMAVRLPKEVPQVPCFPLDLNSAPIMPGDQLVLVSGKQSGMKRAMKGAAGEICYGHDTGYNDDQADSMNRTDCTTNDHTSGSLVLWHDTNHNPFFKAVNTGSNNWLGEKKHYVAGKNDAMVLGLDLDVVNQLDRFQRQGERGAEN